MKGLWEGKNRVRECSRGSEGLPDVPVSSRSGGKIPTPGNTGGVPEKKRKHILVVESNAEDAVLIRGALGDLPFCTSYLCRTLGEARAYLSGTGIYKDRDNFPTPDAIVMNLRLGEDSGYELLTWLKTISGLRGVPIYVVGRTITKQDETTLRGLVTAVFQKPTESHEMLNLFQKIAQEVCGG